MKHVDQWNKIENLDTENSLFWKSIKGNSTEQG